MAIKTFYFEDDKLFRMVFKDSLGVEQTPSTGLVEVVENDGTITIAQTAATIVSNEIQFEYVDLPVGTFRLYFTADFGAGQDEATGIIDYRVLAKDGIAE